MEIRKRRKPRSTPQQFNKSTIQQINIAAAPCRPLACPSRPTGLAGGSAQRWRVSEWWGCVRNCWRFRRRWRRNGARDRIGERHHGRRRESSPNLHFPTAAAHFYFYPPAVPPPFRQLRWRNLHHNSRLHHSASSAGGTSPLTHAAPLAESPNRSTLLRPPGLSVASAQRCRVSWNGEVAFGIVGGSAAGGDVVGGSAASISSAGGSAQRWRVSRNGAHRREKEDNGRRRESSPDMHFPTAAAHLCFFAPTAPRTIPPAPLAEPPP